MDSFFYGVYTNLIWFIICFALFSAAALLWPNIPRQPLIRKDMTADMVYWFILPILYGVIRQVIVVVALLYLLGHNEDAVKHFLEHGSGVVSQWPLWAQIIAILLISDVLQYWIHRWFHESRMWKFHAIHHAPKQIDWLTSARFHPVNFLLYITPLSVLTTLLGFSPAAFAALASFNVLYSGFVHANLNWTLGPLKYVLASPVFHRWHHTSQAEGLDKNFAPTFPFIDMLFGTFYMPKGKLPERFGIHGKQVPDNFIGQLEYPFKK